MNLRFTYIPGISLTDNVRQECRRLLGIAKRNLENNGDLAPVAFIIHQDGVIELLSLDFTSELTKRASFELVRLAAKAVDAIAVIVITDTWYAVRNVPDGLTLDEAIQHALPNYVHGHVRLAPDRREAVQVFAYGPFGYWTILSLYHRSGKIVIWDEERNTDSGGMVSKQMLVRPWWDESQQAKVV